MKEKRPIRETPEFRNAVSRILTLPGGMMLLDKNPDLLETIPIKDLFRHLREEDIERFMESPMIGHLDLERRNDLIQILEERLREVEMRLEDLRKRNGVRGDGNEKPYPS